MMKTYSGVFGCLPLMQHSLADLTRWDDRMSIGNATIDTQDRAIFNLVGEIHDLWRRDSGMGELRATAERASRLLARHFDYEESVLAEIGYPDLAKHAAEHHEMLEDLAAIRRYMARRTGASSGYAGVRLFNFILGVTLGHIVNTDGDYRRYMDDALERLSIGCA